MVIGRDESRCQYVLSDPYVSKRHVRIYTVVYENDEPTEVDTLVYAEDLSQNGTYLNGDFIGKGNGGFLLSDGDVIRLSRRTSLSFHVVNKSKSRATFDFIQEKEMACFRQDYVVTDRLLGAGAFGKVFMSIEQTARTQVACKVVDLRKLTPKLQNQFGRAEQPAAAEYVDNRTQARIVKAWCNQKKREQGVETKLKMYFREIEILASISHPNIIGLEKVYITTNTIYLMQDIVTAGDLFSYIESKNGKLLEAEAAVIIRQILIAVRFLHQNNIVHRDIKPDNILMTSLAAGCRVVLTDFGAARRIQSQRSRMSTVVGTHEYAAPEILRRTHGRLQSKCSNGYTQAVDMWAVGCVAVILLTGGMAFSDPVTCTYSERLARDCDLEFLRKSEDWLAVRQRPRGFVEQLLVMDEKSRMTAEEALQHPWFANEAHKHEFEALYQRTIKHWRPRHPKSPVVDFQDDGTMKHLACKWGFEDFYQKSRARSHRPVEPPYKPFPRNMHLALWPKSDAKKRLSIEVLTAIRKWSPGSAARLARRAMYLSDKEVRVFLAQNVVEPDIGRNTRARTAPPCFPAPESKPAVMNQDCFPRKGRRTVADQEEETAKRAADSGTMLDTPLTRDAHPSNPEKPQASLIPNPNVLFDMINWRNPSTSKLPVPVPVPVPMAQKGSDLTNTGGSGMARKLKLKRRASSASAWASQRRVKRRGSIFDLVEDDDCDGEADFDQEPRNQAARGPSESQAKTAWGTTFPRPELYLPR
ncbi:CAMK/CAMK1 protein kinase [Capronia epimyces CBS 606.96]|uniref:CAMK/CAMK1 protein kinase n=1 Tax=Capronia epimyces CBS 606.96 TaxID=1182542 RepID=W9XHD3_9EURO|nr:CAMK/CAMK1 protein kinase [Capronia epimyces CBS 606.96]EXJ79912.1 CAMK/CAMK1 protein kinase [Capronia epimyces CBS 606.96]